MFFFQIARDKARLGVSDRGLEEYYTI